MVSGKLLAPVQQAASLIRGSNYSVALTGAGSSTPSGIPDFRSQGSGLWTRYAPMEVASLTAFKRDPERFYKWFHPLVIHILESQSNPAHLALAELEKNQFLRTIITQNIDGLHQQAGSQNVLEVHGTLNTLTCIGCYQQVTANEFAELYLEQNIIPHCNQCNNYLKPDVVLFEEQLPARIWLKARQAAEGCDLMIVAGTSLIVSPVAQLPEQAWKNGAKIILINKSPTYMDEHADVLIHGDVAEIIPAIVNEVLHD